MIASPSAPPKTATAGSPVRHLGRDRGGVGDVGRVAHDEVDPARELGKEIGCAHVGGVEHDAAAVRRDVAPRPGERVRVELDGVHDGVRPHGGDGQRERPRAGAQVHDQR